MTDHKSLELISGNTSSVLLKDKSGLSLYGSSDAIEVWHLDKVSKNIIK